MFSIFCDCKHSTMRKRKFPFINFVTPPEEPFRTSVNDIYVDSKQCRYSLTPPEKKNKVIRFHPCFEENTKLSNDSTVAQSIRFYNNSTMFSEYPLKPGEIFLFEVENNDYYNCLSMDVGLAQSEVLGACRGVTSIYHQYPRRVLRRKDCHWTVVPRVVFDGPWPHWCNPTGEPKCIIDGEYIKTIRGQVPLSIFKATENGNRVGIVYIPTSDEEADMHILINGKDSGASVRGILYQESPLHAAIRICCGGGVKIVQYRDMAKLQILCRDAIISSLPDKSKIDSLPVPKSMKSYLMQG